MNGTFLAKVVVFGNGTRVDRNGLPSILLTSQGGTAPSRTVMSGTVARNEGFNVGQLCLVSYTEGEPNEYGRQFSYTKLGNDIVSPLEILQAQQLVGPAVVVNVETTPPTPQASAANEGNFSGEGKEPQAEAVATPTGEGEGEDGNE